MQAALGPSLDEILLKRERCQRNWNSVDATYKDMHAKLTKLKNEIKLHHLNCNIVQVTASSVSIASGVTTIVGLALALAPFTFGIAPIVCTGVGVTGAFLSGTTAIGTLITEAILKSKLLKEVEAIQETYRKLVAEFVAAIQEYARLAAGIRDIPVFQNMQNMPRRNREEFLKYIKMIMQGTHIILRSRYTARDLNNIWAAYRMATEFPEVLNIAQMFTGGGVKLFAESLSKVQLLFKGTPLAMSAVTRYGGMALAGASIVFDTVTLVTRSIELAKRNGTTDVDISFGEIFAGLAAEKAALDEIYNTVFNLNNNEE